MSSTTEQTLQIVRRIGEPGKASWSTLPLELKEQIVEAFLDNVLDKLEFWESRHIDTRLWRTLGDMDEDDRIDHSNIYGCGECIRAIESYFKKHFARDVAALVRSSPSGMMSLINQVASRMCKERYESIKIQRDTKFYFEDMLLEMVASEVRLRRMLSVTPEDDQTEIVVRVCKDDRFCEVGESDYW